MLFTRPKGAPRSGWLGQYDRGGLHKSPRRALLEAPLHCLTLVEPLLEWAQPNLRSIRAKHVPGKLNQGAAMLSWGNISLEEWTLHPPGHLQDIYLKRCKSRAVKIIKDSNHPCNHLFILLPSGKRFRSMMAKTERLGRSFFPQAIRLLNSNSNSVSLHLHLHDSI